MGKQRELLEYITDAAMFGGDIEMRGCIKQRRGAKRDVSRIRRQQAGHSVQ